MKAACAYYSIASTLFEVLIHNFLTPPDLIFPSVDLLLIKFFIFFSGFRMDLMILSRGLEQFMPLLTFVILLFSMKLFLLPSLRASFDGSFFSTYALAWFSKITEVASFESAKVFRRDSVLILFFFSSLLICLHVLILTSATTRAHR